MLRGLLAFALLLFLCAGRGEAAPPASGVSEEAMQRAGMPLLTVQGLRVYHSASATALAEAYGRAIAGALAWYREQLGWDGEIAVAVLDETDWQRFVLLPYPVPHAERLRDLVVMPDSIAQFPGFARWGMDAEALNLALTFHEAGHLIAAQIGLRSGNLWVEELIANIFLAAYVRAERPELAMILAGVPAGFANPGPFDQLFDFDSFYAGGGLENYAWYQFRLAVLADRMVGHVAFPALIASMRAAFPVERVETRHTIAWTLEALEAIAPGSTAVVEDMAGDGVLPQLSPAPCGEMQALVVSGRREGLILLDNRGQEAVAFFIPEAATLGNEESVITVAPGQVLPLQYRATALVRLPDGDCLSIPDGLARYTILAMP